MSKKFIANGCNKNNHRRCTANYEMKFHLVPLLSPSATLKLICKHKFSTFYHRHRSNQLLSERLVIYVQNVSISSLCMCSLLFRIVCYHSLRSFIESGLHNVPALNNQD